jgi:hypothetical protein
MTAVERVQWKKPPSSLLREILSVLQTTSPPCCQLSSRHGLYVTATNFERWRCRKSVHGVAKVKNARLFCCMIWLRLCVQANMYNLHALQREVRVRGRRGWGAIVAVSSCISYKLKGTGGTPNKKTAKKVDIFGYYKLPLPKGED